MTVTSSTKTSKGSDSHNHLILHHQRTIHTSWPPPFHTLYVVDREVFPSSSSLFKRPLSTSNPHDFFPVFLIMSVLSEILVTPVSTKLAEEEWSNCSLPKNEILVPLRFVGWGLWSDYSSRRHTISVYECRALLWPTVRPGVYPQREPSSHLSLPDNLRSKDSSSPIPRRAKGVLLH